MRAFEAQFKSSPITSRELLWCLEHPHDDLSKKIQDAKRAYEKNTDDCDLLFAFTACVTEFRRCHGEPTSYLNSVYALMCLSPYGDAVIGMEKSITTPLGKMFSVVPYVFGDIEGVRFHREVPIQDIGGDVFVRRFDFECDLAQRDITTDFIESDKLNGDEFFVCCGELDDGRGHTVWCFPSLGDNQSIVIDYGITMSRADLPRLSENGRYVNRRFVIKKFVKVHDLNIRALPMFDM